MERTQKFSASIPRRLPKHLAVKVFKFVVGILACVEVFVMGINMSYLMRQLLGKFDQHHLPYKWVIQLYIFAVIAAYMAFPLLSGMVIGRTKVTTGRSTLWVCLLVPLRCATLAFLVVNLAGFHYMIIPHVLSTSAILVFYAFALKARWCDEHQQEEEKPSSKVAEKV